MRNESKHSCIQERFSKSKFLCLRNLSLYRSSSCLMPKAQSRLYLAAKCLSVLAIIYIVLNQDKVGYGSNELVTFYARFTTFYWAMIIIRGQNIINDLNIIGISGLTLSFLHYSTGFFSIVHMILIGMGVNVPALWNFPLIVLCIAPPILCWQTIESDENN